LFPLNSLGDINRPEVLRNFNVGAARACVFAIDDMTAINKVITTLHVHALDVASSPLFLYSASLHLDLALTSLLSLRLHHRL
jgi:hypothetical protein